MALTKISRSLLDTGISDSSDATAITIDSSEKTTFSGDVEVGTTAPKINLKNTDTSIVADQSLGVIEIESTDGSTGSAGTIAKLDIAASGAFDGSGHGSDFRFTTGATNQSGSIALSEVMRLSATGNLGLSSTTAKRFVVNQTGTSGYFLSGEASGTEIAYWYYDANQVQFSSKRSGKHMAFLIEDSETMRLDTGGNLLLGTTTTNIDGSSGEGVALRNDQASLFTVEDDVVMGLNRRGSDGTILIFRNDGSSVGTISTGSNSLPSDRNFKRDIEDLEIGLDLIKKLKPSQYNYKIQDEDAPKLYGLIAQDLEQSLAEVGIEKNSTSLLQHNPNDNEKESDYDLDYLKLTPVLINAIQEQQTQIEALQSEINTLKGE